MTDTFRLLKNKNAGAYIYLGAVFMIVGFIATLACMHFFEMYVSRTRAQLICDAIADGAAVAGQSHIGFSESRAESMANKLFAKNSASADADFTMEIVDETDSHGNPTGDKLIKVYYTSTRDPILNGGLLRRAYTVHANATVKVKITYEQQYVLSESYWGNAYYNSVPFATTTPGNRNPAYVSWLINFYLNPEYSEMYMQSWTNALNRDVNSFFLFDYFRLMAIDLGPGGVTCHIDDYTSLGNSGMPGLPGGSGLPGLGGGTGTSGGQTLRKEIENNGNLPFPGWTPVSGAQNIQSIANTGKPVVIFTVGNSQRTMRAYVVVPQNGNLPDGCIAVAYFDEQGQKSNYEVYDLEFALELGQHGMGIEKAYAFWHE